ncbi:bifunctional (p)ppGpp synthetase/guanosine-3',5'-bis(diphosphate) 3'-pyrophosphohydrolase [Clostridium sporogenes]|uniref:RelA/SpoT family protein n=1 Tax=Clostridium sporogenes TaxID=1509 RepID=UPI0013C5E18E|nr:bifunctional (p)ppGpp synthetase/guanosine-3',5'-bis(diphosphate) 3'-pyrophosphohydrolase [Clostridium sporogenes]MBW5457773.1 RelA/SpoT family protein [Clostridium sporogenes]NFQ02780.1 bifunctional (p)ppGpp synthetase/guanosine-3',5'-bis(diphosphate) 3'-pyrophosphohydrolase [Clostridium sporogenes]NFQ41590.1 bifunctional (p)ppGpp synthetase/guanosine-3',5'-bis(diphosphate) 3'-pyrophosphohydrolase [Clostridium sporogenes]NFT03251.1 bifunctional (p)ppGpp synthetase/guanosine-3',5'-bis(diphos
MLEDLMIKIKDSFTEKEIEFIKKAYNFACNAHKEQKRISGEPYITHPEEVAIILFEMGMDVNTMIAGLMHDVVEDTQYTYEDVAKEFGNEVADLVNGVTKLGKIEYKTKEEQQADNVRKMLLAMTKDIRVILIKLADRLHNMRTLRFMPVEKQKEKAQETLDIYAPLAHRLGISKIKWELEDLSFRYINPNEYYFLVRKIAEKRAEREEHIKEIVLNLQQNLKKAGIESEIDGRPKHFYSIYKKMHNKNKNLDQIFDLTAVRILVDTVKDCYAALGIAHTVYKPIPGRFKDYIAMPKPNMYQSLHSTVMGVGGRPFEIQIRTYEMHKTAEYGIAAHWKYKEAVENSNNIDLKLTWLREMLDWQKETTDPEEFMQGFKIDLFSDEVFVFTPKGKVISLPNRATPVDFAYKIHTDIGHRCIGAKVNGKMVPLDYELKTGEIIEVLTSTTPKGPNLDWLSMVKSNQAKSKIRAWFKKEDKEENINKGKDILEKETKKQGYNFGELAKGEVLETVLKRYNMSSIEDMFAAVGIGALAASAVVLRFREQYLKKNKPELNWNEVRDQISKSNKQKKKKSSSPGVIVKGEDNLLVRFAKCCNPVPGDKIIGYITKGRGISIHRTDCKNVEQLVEEDPTKIVEVSWGKPKGGEYISELEVRAENTDGLLADIMLTINGSKTNLYAVNAQPIKNDSVVVNIKLKISNIEDLKSVMKDIRKLKGVLEVYRTKK